MQQSTLLCNQFSRLAKCNSYFFREIFSVLCLIACWLRYIYLNRLNTFAASSCYCPNWLVFEPTLYLPLPLCDRTPTLPSFLSSCIFQTLENSPLFFHTFVTSNLLQEHQVKDGLALEFLLDLLSTLKTEKGGTAVVNVVKKSGIESRLMEFFPSVNQQQTEDNFSKTFLSRDLPEIVSFRKAQAAQNTKNSLYRMVREAIEEEKPVKEIILEIKESLTRTSIQEQDAVVMVCTFYLKRNLLVL